MIPLKHMLSGRERKVSQLLAEIERHPASVESTGEYHVYAYTPHRSSWGTWAYHTSAILRHLPEQFAILSEPKLRADRILSYLWRAMRPEADDVRQLRAELVQSRELLLRLAKATGVTVPAPATDAELRIAAEAAAEAVAGTFGRGHVKQVVSEAESDPDTGASHRVLVQVSVGSASQPETLAEARSQFFKQLGEKLPAAVSAKVRVVLDLLP